MSNLERVKARYHSLKAAGLCVICGQHEPSEGHVQCDDCIAEAKEKRRELTAKRRCLGCRKPTDGMVRCVKCVSRAKATIEKKRQTGKCTRCDKPAAVGKKLCSQCAKKLSTPYLQRKSLGLCHTCPNPTMEGRARCESCHLKEQAKREAKKQRGECTSCCCPKLLNSNMCIEHYFKNVARRHLETPTRWTEIRDKWEAQQYRCFYTGVELTLGLNTSIDHVVPKCRGGTAELENLVWCQTIVNIAKFKLNTPAFLEMCRQVVAYADRDLREG